MIFKIGKPKDGWVNISISIKSERILNIWGSQVYDPLYEIPEILEILKKRKKYVWQVDQEGKLGIVIMRPINRNIYELMMTNNYDKEVLKKYLISREELINTMFKASLKFSKLSDTDGFYIDRRDLVKSK